MKFAIFDYLWLSSGKVHFTVFKNGEGNLSIQIQTQLEPKGYIFLFF